MVSAICFINTELGKEIKVRKEVSMFEGVKKVIELFGDFDLMVLIKADELRQINFIVDHIRKIDGVRNTKTYIEAEI
ncbi:MAG: hypothetical protein DRN25_00595 [Thermoplasmata archaeon]|nr:MAG: hypothetical protein DRN25_00595 [Thermoplasmata archaeon]